MDLDHDRELIFYSTPNGDLTSGSSSFLYDLQIDKIQEIEVRKALALWRGMARELLQYNLAAETLSTEGTILFFKHPEMQQNWLFGTESLDAYVNLSDLQNDVDLKAIVSAMQQREFVLRLFMTNLQEQNEELRQLISPLIK